MATGSIKLVSRRQSPAQLRQMMGERKHGLNAASARREHGVAHFQLKDPSDHLVAEGSGRSVSEAENAALESTTNDGARASATSESSGIADRLTY
jgi:hypothetical protein